MRSIFAKMRMVKIKFFIITIMILAVYLFLFYIVFEVYVSRQKPTVKNSVNLPYVVVHLDLKGSPPKLEYLKNQLPVFKELGVNGLLIEYEDMFPYEGKLANLSAKNCYTKTELKQFLLSAAFTGFEIIPLVQTFGHLEFALKLEEFQHLREEISYPDSICPSKTESIVFVKQMLQQVIKFHNSVAPLKFIHVGCDEVYHINTCQHCEKRHLSNLELYLQHLKMVTETVKSLTEDTTILIWDDMLRSVKMVEWNKINDVNFNNIEPVYWDYGPNLQVSHINLMKYHQKFSNIWIASAFKGADGRAAVLPNIKQRFNNHFSWMDFILDYRFGGESAVYSFKGIILTGWSRYSHMDPACELLPASIPSLILNLLLVKTYKEGIIVNEDNDGAMDVNDFITEHLEADVNKRLNCDSRNTFDVFELSSCAFDGKDLYDILRECMFLSINIIRDMNDENLSLLNLEYYSLSDRINKNAISTYMDWCNNSLKEIYLLENRMTKALLNYYEEEFVTEYVSSKTFGIKKQIYKLVTILSKYLNIRIWKRGPSEVIATFT